MKTVAHAVAEAKIYTLVAPFSVHSACVILDHLEGIREGKNSANHSARISEVMEIIKVVREEFDGINLGGFCAEMMKAII